MTTHLEYETTGDSHSYHNSGKTIQYRFLIPQSAAGGIIGRKGENIKNLRNRFNCDVSVPACDAPERLMILNADTNTLRNVVADVLNTVQDCMNAKVNDPKDINNGIIPENPVTDEMDLRFLVSENVCGGVIGKGGETIRGLTDTYKVSVFKVYQQMCPNSSDRVIRLVGLPEDILNCLVAIHEIILNLKDIKSHREYDPANFNESQAVNYGGWVSLDGRRRLAQTGPLCSALPPYKSGDCNYPYPNSNQLGDQYLNNPSISTVPITNQFHSTPSFLGMPIGHMADYIHPDCIIMEIQSEMYEQSQNPVSTDFSMAAAVPKHRKSQPSFDGPAELSHVSLPNKLIGAIMGRGGCRINEIRETTGAKIDVDKEVMPNSDDRIITIQGSRDQIHKAQALLQLNVKKYGGKY